MSAEDSRLRAIATMLAAVAIFSFMDAVLKMLAARYPPMQVAALRGATSLPFTLAPVLFARRYADLRAHRIRMHLLRGSLSVLVLGGFILAVRELSLANAYALFLSAPLMVAALSVPLLREHVDWPRWIAILVGLGGVAAMLRVSASGLGMLGALAALGSAFAYALSALTVRVMTRSETTVSVVFWAVGVMTVISTLIALPHWVPVGRSDFKWLAALGLLAAVGQYLLTEAFRRAPPSVVAPFEYTTLLWGVGFDRLIWNVLPAPRVWAGGAVVIASGLYLIWRERAAAGRMSRAAPAAAATATRPGEHTP